MNKNILKSVTVWGVLLLIFGKLKDQLGWSISDTELETYLNFIVPIVITLYGRLRQNNLTLRPVKAVAPLILLIPFLLGCGTTGAQGQDTSQGTVDMTARGGLFYGYAEAGRGSKRTTTAPVLDKRGVPVLDADGNPLFTTIIEEGASGPLILNYGTVSADIDQAPQGSQAGSGTQQKTDTATPKTEVSPTTSLPVGP